MGKQILFDASRIAEALPVAAVPLVSIMTLKDDVQRGDIVSSESVRWVLKSPGDVLSGQMTRAAFDQEENLFFTFADNVSANSAVFRNQIVLPSNSNYLPTVLRSGYRATAVTFKKWGALIETLSPGSYLDLAYTKNHERDYGSAGIAGSGIIAKNVRVLSNDNFRKREGLGKPLNKKSRDFTVILEITKKQADTISGIANHGNIVPLLKPFSESADFVESIKQVIDAHTPAPFSGAGEQNTIKQLRTEPSIPVSRTVFVHRGRETMSVQRGKSLSYTPVGSFVTDRK